MYNSITIVGNLGRDPEMRYLPNGTACAVFSVATTEKWKDRDGNKQERTDWHRVEFIGPVAEVCGDWLHKGDRVLIEGRMRYDKFKDKDDNERTVAKIMGNTMKMLSTKRDGDGDHGNGGGNQSPRQGGNQGDNQGGQRYDTQQSNQRGSQQGNQSQRPRTKLDDFDDDIPFN